MQQQAKRPSIFEEGKWVFVAPWFVGFVVLMLVPLGGSLLLSFTDWDGLSLSDDVTWVGAENYRKILAVDASAPCGEGDPWYWRLLGGRPHDTKFYQSLCNSLYFAAFSVPVGLVASLGMALLLARSVRGIALFRTVYYLPHVLAGVGTILMWQWVFAPQVGPLNGAIRLVYALLDPLWRLFGSSTSGWPVPQWLYSPGGCKPAVVVMQLWATGGAMLIFLAAVKRVPEALYEAASIDGASAWQRFHHVTLPQISPVILFNLVMGIVVSLQAFNPAYLLRHYSQNDGLLFYVLHLYATAFESPYRLGYASAMAWILFVILMVLTLVTFRSGRWWAYYEVN